jgi:hypothetical protein
MSRTFAVLAVLVALAAGSRAPAAEVAEVVDVEPVWSAHPVGFSLLTHGDTQFIAYYDAQRRMTVAQRRLGQRPWIMQKLPRTTGWDSHNSIVMAIDPDGQLHVSGDMHNVPLVYFRTSRPLDVTSLQPVHRMTGQREARVTYPVFIRDREGGLIFRYRDGRSGSGDDLYNRYDPATRSWRRLVDQPIVSGEGQRNAYCSIPRLGPDGFFHMVWVWRDTPDAATNHNPSYARSHDLVDWQTAGGAPLRLPITLGTGDIVDPVPARGGVINGNVQVGLDSENRPVVTYHKYDARGRTQIYTSRWEEDRWAVRQISDWDYRWDFGGGGTIIFEVRVGRIEPIAPGRLAMGFRHPGGAGTWVLDEQTLAIVPGERAPARPGLPAELRRIESSFPGMIKRIAHDTSARDVDDAEYVLVWETLPQNRDRPRPPPLPEATMLRVVKIRR